MRLEDMKQEFPQMPQSMRDMVEREVQKQVKMVPARRYFSVKKAVVASLVATMALGTTIFAGVKIYQMDREPQGNYGVTTKVSKNEAVEATEQENTKIDEIPDITMETSYLPDGMVELEEGKYSYEKTPYEGGVSIIFYRMDMGDSAFEILDTYVTESENLQIGNHDGVYLKMQENDGDWLSFNQRIYVTYPEYHYVMQMYIGEDVTKDEALKIAEGVKIIPVADETEENMVHAWNWSDYLASIEEDDDSWEKDAATAEEMKNTHAIGETIQSDTEKNIQMKVTDVKITEDTGILDMAYSDNDFSHYIDNNGKLFPTTIQYIKSGDGINTLDEVISTKQVQQKLIYVTIQYVNIGSEDMKDILYSVGLMKIRKENGSYVVFREEQPKTDDIWDYALDTSTLMKGGDMSYYDVRGGERGNNYITALKAGETKTVHVGFVVNEDELPYLYLNLNTAGGTAEFSDSALKQGLVDIRQ